MVEGVYWRDEKFDLLVKRDKGEGMVGVDDTLNKFRG